jgi:hypothetical protein
MRCRCATWLLAATATLAAGCKGSTGPAGSRILITSGANQTGRADSTLSLALTVFLTGTRQPAHRGILFAPTADTTYVHHPLAAGNCTVLVERTDSLGGNRCSAVDSTNGSGQAFIVLTMGPTPGPGRLVVTLLQPLQSDTVTFTITP